ncbi:divalent-cation tolerance protein CutA [Bradyrhizobium sp. LHD-71]|uniref:divalent-cation tolerance protein CutA n=1 Tax=Bradyrhizobium sp. LHD-71 TaxID=3072141 RepID=UPI00280EE2E4|nr:divalent-cation tolerance protein CutA [Bradyrhizobium sp. LHD-71]MDQ8726544.1 divalent-cation tolerance protein CutA [Bradyrhizobium sp. LHD-71]
MDRAVLVYTTFPSLVEAEAATKVIVEQRLAACANILPGMISHYRWEGKVERADEVVVIFKTRASLADEVRKAVRDNHSYEVPAVTVIALESVDRDYFGWILDSTKSDQS